MEILNIKNLNFKYNGAEKNVINNLSFSVNEGEVLLLCGETGSGKTTLLKLLKKVLSPSGIIEGEIFFRNKNLCSNKDNWDGVGIVMQNPASQIVTDSVMREIAFGPESIGIDPQKIRMRVAEMAQYFGLEENLSDGTDKLSGGRQQMLNLASVMAMRPALLLLDEPTSQLDPLAAREFISVIKRLSEETGTTIIIAEHRLEDIFPISDKVLVLKDGASYAFGTPKQVAACLVSSYMQKALPSATRIFIKLGEKGDPPLTVREGKRFIENYDNKVCEIKQQDNLKKVIALSIKEIFFKYEKSSPDILSCLSLKVFKGEFLSIVGGNATGKTTLLSVVSGQRKPYMGKIKLFGKKYSEYKNFYRDNIAYLPQDVITVFITESLIEDCFEILETEDLTKSKKEEIIREKAALLGIEHKLNSHPYDLSGGERQKAALLKILLLNPKVLLLDEPTKGIDPVTKEHLGKILRKLCKQGVTVVSVSHDIEFAAEFSDRCAQISQGKIIACDSPQKLFSDNSFYTTAAARISNGKYHNAVLVDDVVWLLNQNKRIND